MSTDHLVCGRPVEGVLTQVAASRADELDAHQRGCVHCQAALGEYNRLWGPVHDLVTQPVTTPSGVVDSALARLRGVVEHDEYGVVDSPVGVTRIAARVVIVAAREVAAMVPGVRAALSKHLTDPTTEVRSVTAAAGVAGRSTAIEVTIAATYGVDLMALGEQVRAAVTAHVQIITDLEPVHITVVIDDVFE